MAKIKFKRAQNYHWDRFKFNNKLCLENTDLENAGHRPQTSKTQTLKNNYDIMFGKLADQGPHTVYGCWIYANHRNFLQIPLSDVALQVFCVV